MDTATRVDLGYLPLEHFSSVSHAACGGDTCDENLNAICLQDLHDPAPMSHLHRSNGGSDSNKVKPKEAMAEHDRIFRGEVCINSSEQQESVS
jgi:hypothetical protein